MKIKIKNIPEGYKIQNNKLVKLMREGGSTATTLQPIDREDANIEAEKNETVLTDINSDGFFELFNIGGKRHSEGGTPLNLPEQSFIFSDTRKMKFTKEELLELGITSPKKMTPAAVSKKYPINKYLDVLKDESADKISVTSAEAMVKKNKVKLSHIAFMQEKKKNFEDGLPLAAYPYLLENGIDPQELEQKIMQSQQREQASAQGGMHQMPDGSMMPDSEMNAPPQMQAPQMQAPQMQAQGMMPPMAMGMNGMELNNFVYGQGGEPNNEGFKALPESVQNNIMQRKNGGEEGTMDPAQMQMQQLAQAQAQLAQQREMIMMAVQENPEQFESEAAQFELSSQLQKLDMDLSNVSMQLQQLSEEQFLQQTTIPLDEFIGETTQEQNKNMFLDKDLFKAEEGVEMSDDERIAQFQNNQANGTAAHQKFYDIVNQENYEPVRNAWIKAYADMDNDQKIDETDPQVLFDAFNKMNLLFNQSVATQTKYGDGSTGSIADTLAANAEKLGMDVPTDREIRMYQGMYNSLATAKELGSDEVKNLLQQVNINYSENQGGAYEIVEGSGRYVSNIDGLVGDNTSQQYASISDDTGVDIVENNCDEETKRLKIQECMEKGLPFNAGACDCGIAEPKIEVGEKPPYMTFAGDDMKVGALSALTMGRDKKYGVLQNYNPIMRDPGYIDDRAAVAATTALANQAMAVSRNPSDVQGKAQDAIDKIQANRYGTNTKIFDNTQAYNVAELNKAQSANKDFMSDYTDMVNTVDQNYDNVKGADMMNLVDAEINRNDNASRLYQENLRRPNFYFDGQSGETIFQNEDGLKAYQSQNESNQPVTMADAMADCVKMGFEQGSAEQVNCAKLRLGQNSNNNSNRNTPTEENSNNNQNSLKFGGSVRTKDLMESKIKLRKWIMGI